MIRVAAHADHAVAVEVHEDPARRRADAAVTHPFLAYRMSLPQRAGSPSQRCAMRYGNNMLSSPQWAGIA
jgi:hypothetical protein